MLLKRPSVRSTRRSASSQSKIARIHRCSVDPFPYMNRYSARVSNALPWSSPELSADIRSSKITISRSPVSRSLGRSSFKKDAALFSFLCRDTGRCFLGSGDCGCAVGEHFGGIGAGAAWKRSSSGSCLEARFGAGSFTDLRVYVPSG